MMHEIHEWTAQSIFQSLGGVGCVCAYAHKRYTPSMANGCNNHRVING